MAASVLRRGPPHAKLDAHRLGPDRHARDLHAHEVLVRQVDLVVHPHAEGGAVERLGADVQLGLPERGEGLGEGVSGALLGLGGTAQAAHQLEDQNLAFLFEQIVAFLGKRELPLQGEQIRLGRRDVQLCHIPSSPARLSRGPGRLPRSALR